MDLLPLTGRVELLKSVLAFTGAPLAALQALAPLVEEEEYVVGSVALREGDRVDTLSIIAAGQTEVTTQTPSGPVTLASQEAGEIFGELALLSPMRRRTARRTVTALTPLRVLTLTAPHAADLVQRYPEMRPIFETPGEVMLVARFLKRASPFARLSPAQAQWLASRLEAIPVAAGATIRRQDEHGDRCFLIEAGRVEVVMRDAADAERRIAILGQGHIVGETALLSEEPDNITVRALESSELLALRRGDLLAAMAADRQVGNELLELVRLRDRPSRAPGIAVHQRTTADGQVVVVLKNPTRHTYYQLSARGWFLWERLDGDHTLRDLTLDYREAFGSFAPQVVADLIQNLTAAGFVLPRTLRNDVRSLARAGAPSQTLATRARRILELQRTLHGVDGLLTRLYRGGIFLLYTWPGQLFLFLLVAAGFAAFVLSSVRAATYISETDAGAALLLLIVPAEWLSILAHEAGHAFTTKAFGREVSSIGMGWYWFGPTFFVDTSDMWLAGRWPRIAVSLAGPYTNLVLGGIIAIGGWFAPGAALTAACWQIALTSYVIALLSLDPLLEYDGYYVLMDLLDRPNLRKHSLMWLGHELPKALRRPNELRRHRLELVYGVCSVLYVLVMSLVTLVIYRLAVENWMRYLLPTPAAAALAWICALAVAILTTVAVVDDLRRTGGGATAPPFRDSR